MSKDPDAPRLTADGSKADLRARLANLRPGHPSEAGYSDRPPTDSAWRQARAGFTEVWQRHQERWPHPQEKAERRELSTTVERELADGCDKIQAAEEEITSQLLAIEADQPGRVLVGLEFRLKGRDRIIEKAQQNLENKPDRTPEAALALIPDAVRYTFCYGNQDYAAGVRDDIARLKSEGFEVLKFKNFWGDAEYRGINSQWLDERTGQRFEVQFHTAYSFHAKQVTHGAYERLRTGDMTDDEEHELEMFQRRVTATVPFPLGALDVAEHS